MKISEMLREAAADTYYSYLLKAGAAFLKEVEKKIKPLVGNKIKTQVAHHALSGRGTKDGQEVVFQMSIAPGGDAVLRLIIDDSTDEPSRSETLKIQANRLTPDAAIAFFKKHWK